LAPRSPLYSKPGLLHRAVVCGLALGLAYAGTGCSQTATLPPAATASPAAFALTVYDLDGPEADVRINGQKVGHVTCQVVSYSFLLEVDPASSPPLPWTVDLVRADGSLVATFLETGAGGSRTIFLRASGTFEQSTGLPVGPAPAATCRP